MSWEKQAFVWSKETIDKFKKSLGEGARARTDDEVRGILDGVVKSQQLDLLLAIVNQQLIELVRMNDHKWKIIDALMEDNNEEAAKLLNEMSEFLASTMQEEIYKKELSKTKKAVQQTSNVIQFKREK